jgi:hypothetical protein
VAYRAFLILAAVELMVLQLFLGLLNAVGCIDVLVEFVGVNSTA